MNLYFLNNITYAGWIVEANVELFEALSELTIRRYPPTPFSNDQLYMEDAPSAETREKSIFRFL